MLDYCREANAGKNTWQSGTLGEVGTLAIVLMMFATVATIAAAASIIPINLKLLVSYFLFCIVGTEGSQGV